MTIVRILLAITLLIVILTIADGRGYELGLSVFKAISFLGALLIIGWIVYVLGSKK